MPDRGSATRVVVIVVGVLAGAFALLVGANFLVFLLVANSFNLDFDLGPTTLGVNLIRWSTGAGSEAQFDETACPR